jgi:ubiquinol-cytochrome c reductase iron-sulfur subunit
VRASPKGWLVAALLLLVRGRRRRRGEPAEPERIVAAGEPDPRSELVVVALLFLGALLALGFVAVYALDRLAHQTQLLGATLGLSLLVIAAALIVTARRLVVTEELEEPYPPLDHAEDQQAVVQIVEESASRVTRRRLFGLGLAASGGSLGLALLAPLASLGPVLDMESFYGTPWRRGRRLVDEVGRPLRAADIEEEALYTAFPERIDREQLGSPVILVRLAPDALRLTGGVAGFATRGIVAYSKICTHAGCAVSLYRTPLFEPTDPKPALVCPCHYSTFDPASGGTVLYGPAGRKLPMLPLMVDRRGNLRAAGTFDEPVGVSWWGVRLRRPA